jgi:hypothetical protein
MRLAIESALQKKGGKKENDRPAGEGQADERTSRGTVDHRPGNYTFDK